MEGSQKFDEARRYALGQMSAAEQAVFEQKLANDKELSDELALFTTTQEAIGQLSEARKQTGAIRDRLRAEGFFEKTHAEIRAKNAAAAAQQTGTAPAGRTVQLSQRRAWMAIAAGLVLLAVALPFLLKKPPMPSFDVVAEAKKGSGAPMLAGYSDRDTARIVDSLLLVGQPDAALLMIGELTKKDKEITLREGRAYLMKGQFATAAERFELLMNDPNTLFRTLQAARYFAAICYAGTGQTERSRALFEQVAATRDLDGNPGEFSEAASGHLLKFR